MAETEPTQTYKKPRRYLARVMLFALSFLLLVGITLQMAIWAGFFWLSTDAGQVWTEKQLASLTAETGYRIEVDGLFMPSLSRITAREIRIVDDSGLLVKVEKIAFDLAVGKLAVNTLATSVRADHVLINRLPAPVEADTPAESNQPFSIPSFVLPELPMNRFSIDIAVRKFLVSQDIIADGLMLSPVLSAQAVTKGNTLSLTAALRDRAQENLVFPTRVDMSTVLMGDDRQVQLQNLDIDHPAYHVVATGQVISQNKTRLQADVKMRVNDLAALTAGQQAGSLEATATVTGTPEKPQVTLDALATPQGWVTAGGKDITLKAMVTPQDDALAANFSLSSVYKEQPVTLDVEGVYDGSILRLPVINGTAPDSRLSGNLQIHVPSQMAEGTVNLIADLAAYQSLVTIPLAGKVAAQLDVFEQSQKQSVALDVQATDIQVADTAIQKLSLVTRLDDISQGLPQRADLTLSGLRQAGAVVEDLSATLTHDSDNATYNLGYQGRGHYKSVFDFKGDVTLSGDLSVPEIVSELSLHIPEQKTEQGDDIPAFGVSASGTYKNEMVRLDVTGTGESVKNLSAKTAFPATLSLQPLDWHLDDSIEPSMQVDTDFSLRPLSPFFMPVGMALSGQLSTQADITLPPAAFGVTGEMSLTDGTLAGAGDKPLLRHITAQASFDDKTIRLENLRATDTGDGVVSATATVGLSAALPVEMTLDVKSLQTAQPGQRVKGLFNAALALSGDKQGYELSGKIMPESVAITIPERFVSSVPKLNIVDPSREKTLADNMLEKIALDLVLQADNRVFVRGWGLDAEFGGELEITGTAAEPLTNGNLSLRRGYYEEFGKRFSIKRADLRFQGTVPPSPYLDILTQTQAGDVTAQIGLTGALTDPVVQFSSIPALPEDEVLARILFGKTMANISPFQAVQLAQTLRRFSGQGGGGLDPVGQLRAVTGLDTLSVESDEDGETVVGAGKYLSDKVYLGVESGTGEAGGAATLEIELTPKVKLESRIGNDEQSGAGVLWQWDY